MEKLIISFLIIFNIHILFSVEIPVPKDVHSIICPDVNLDNNVDILIGSSQSSSPHDSITVLINNGSGEFNKSSFEKNNGFVLKYEKIDNDEYNDIITFAGPNVVYYSNNGDLTFGESTQIHQFIDSHEKIEVADMNNDGDNDVVFWRHHSDSYWGICKNNGVGNFTEIPEEVCYTTDGVISNLSIGIINDDDYNDVLIARNFGAQVFYNTGNYNFEEVLIDSFPADNSYIKDMDGNGLTDIVMFAHNYIMNIPCYMKIFYNWGNEVFIESDTLNFPCGTHIKDITDLNNDGYLDLICGRGDWNGPNENIFIYMYDTNDAFVETAIYHIGYPQLGFLVTSADLDNNGYNDIVVSRYWYQLEFSRHAVRILFNDGNGSFSDEPFVSIDDEEVLINKYKLSNYPNPFNPTTTISFSIPDESRIDLIVYNIKGQKVKTLMDCTTAPGTYECNWNGKDESGKPVSSGQYIVKLQQNSEETVKKIMLLK